MNTRLAAAVLAFGLAASPSLPAFAAVVTARDAQGVAHLNLDTQIVPQRGAGYYGGTLKLTISRDGIVNGIYRPEDGDGGFHTVVGGLNGDQIWLNISYLGGLHVSGVLSGSKIVGGTFIGTHFFDFNASPPKA
jgi:hypothetical protein